MTSHGVLELMTMLTSNCLHDNALRLPSGHLNTGHDQNALLLLCCTKTCSQELVGAIAPIDALYAASVHPGHKPCKKP